MRSACSSDSAAPATRRETPRDPLGLRHRAHAAVPRQGGGDARPLGARGWLARGGRPECRGLRILLYHRVADDGDPLALPPRRFREQMDHLAAEGYRARRPRSSALEALERGASSERTIALTFDDGFADVAEQALPALERHGFRATVFVTTGVTDGRVAFPWYEAASRRCSGWDDVVALDREGTLRFEAHTVSHPSLLAVATRPPRRAEIAGLAARARRAPRPAACRRSPTPPGSTASASAGWWRRPATPSRCPASPASTVPGERPVRSAPAADRLPRPVARLQGEGRRRTRHTAAAAGHLPPAALRHAGELAGVELEMGGAERARVESIACPRAAGRAHAARAARRRRAGAPARAPARRARRPAPADPSRRRPPARRRRRRRRRPPAARPPSPRGSRAARPPMRLASTNTSAAASSAGTSSRSPSSATRSVEAVRAQLFLHARLVAAAADEGERVAAPRREPAARAPASAGPWGRRAGRRSRSAAGRRRVGARGARSTSIALGITTVRSARQVRAASPAARSVSDTQIVTVVSGASSRSAQR